MGPVFVGAVGSCQWRSSDQIQVGAPERMMKAGKLPEVLELELQGAVQFPLGNT